MIQEELERRIKTTSDLQGIVRTMKMLSSVSLTQYQKALNSLGQYGKTLQQAFHGLFTQSFFNYTPPTLKTTTPKVLAVVIGSDNGLVGRFNKDILNFVKKSCSELGALQSQVKIISVGKRIALLGKSMNFHLSHSYPISNSIKEIAALAGMILTKIDQEISSNHFDLVEIFYNKQQNISFSPQMRQLMPLPQAELAKLKKMPWEGKMLPLISAEKEVLFSALLREYFAIVLIHALTSSLAAEHFTRMNHMQQAEKNIEERLSKLNLEYQQARQNQITDELIDIVSGATAVTKKKLSTS